MKLLAQKRSKGENLSWRAFAQSEYQTTPEAVLKELGINPNTTTVQQMLDLDEDSRALFPEFIRDAIIIGMEKDPIYNDLIAQEESISEKAYSMPYIDLSKMNEMKGKLRATKGSTPRELQFEVKTKIIRTIPVKTVLRVPYTSIRQSSINMLPIHLRGTSARFQGDINTQCFNVLKNGDNGVDEISNQPVDSSPAIIGVGNTTNGVTEDDYIQAAIRFSRLRIPATTMCADEALSKKIVKFDEFKYRRQGTVDTRLNFKFPLPNELDYFPTNDIDPGNMMLLSRYFALVKIVSQGIMVENDKDIIRQLHRGVVSTDVGFGILYRNGRVFIDGSKEFASNGFPDWFDYAS